MNVGIIGLGRHGTRYAHHLLTPESPGKLVAICRRDPEQGRAFADQHQLRFHQQYQSLIRDPEVEVIIVVTPPSLNKTIAIEAIHNRKPLLIEKPLAISSTEARQIVEHAAQANVPLMTAQTLRYDATIVKLKEWGQEIGQWQYLSLTSRLEQRPHSPEEMNAWNRRGAILEIGIHLLDLVRFLTGEEVREVYCEIPESDLGAPENQAWGRLTTLSGIPCLLDISRVSNSRMTRVELIGQTGQLRVNWTTGFVTLLKQRNPLKKHQLPPTPTIQYVLNDFIYALKTGTPMPITGEDGLRAVEIAEACYESASLKQAVRLGGFP